MIRIVPLLMLLAGQSRVVAQTLFLDSDAHASKVVAAIYPDVGLKPLAIIRVDQIYRDYQTRGFFRIGVLPLLVLDGLSLELCNTNQWSAALTHASLQFSSKGKESRAVEGRNFSLSFSGQTNGFICANTVRLENGTEWLLRKGKVDQPGATPISFRRATLVVAGPKAGDLTCETVGGAVRIHLLSLAPVMNHESTKP